MRILFSNEEMCDLNGIYNSQNDIIWAINRAEVDDKGDIKQIENFSQKVMVWLGVYSKGVTPLIIFDERTLDHECYIKKVLSMAKKYGDKVVGND